MALDFEGSERATARDPLTVSALNRAVAGLLERSFPLVRVRGEVANLTRAAQRPLVFRSEGRPGTGALRDVPQPQPVAELDAARWRRGRAVRRRVTVRGARRIPVERSSRCDAPDRGACSKSSCGSKAKLAAEGRLRQRRQAVAAGGPARHRRRHVAAGGRAARRAHVPGAPRALRGGDRLSGTGPGRRRRDSGSPPCSPGCRRAPKSTSSAGPRRRVDRGPVGVQRRGGCPRDPRVGAARRRRAWATKATSRSPTSPPIYGRRRRPRRPRWWRLRATPCSRKWRAACSR